MRKVYLYSPIPPIKSGTANYLKLFVNDLPSDFTETHDVTLVIDERFYDKVPKIYDSIPVKSYNDIMDDSPDSVFVYFLANNEFHRYIHRALFLHSSGKAVSVVHEPSMWMNVGSMCYLEEYGFKREDLTYFAGYEFGANANQFVNLFYRYGIDKNFSYVSLAGTHIYEKSDVIVFHSQYAKDKFQCEKSDTYQKPGCKEYWVMAHPDDHTAPKGNRKLSRKDSGTFVVSTFGWVGPTKQTIPLIKAFYDFIGVLPKAHRERCRLDVVGEVPADKNFYDPIGFAKSRHDLVDRVKFYGYTTDEEFINLLHSSSLVFSLRFPSCGETSGPIHKLSGVKIPVAISDYAAFSEENADFYISVNPRMQHDQLVELMRNSYTTFLEEGSTESLVSRDQRPANKSTKLDVPGMLNKLEAHLSR